MKPFFSGLGGPVHSIDFYGQRNIQSFHDNQMSSSGPGSGQSQNSQSHNLKVKERTRDDIIIKMHLPTGRIVE